HCGDGVVGGRGAYASARLLCGIVELVATARTGKARALAEPRGPQRDGGGQDRPLMSDLDPLVLGCGRCARPWRPRAGGSRPISGRPCRCVEEGMGKTKAFATSR